MSRLLDAYQDGLMEKSDLSFRKSRLDQERHSLSERIAHLQRHESQQRVKDQVMDKFTSFWGAIQAALDNPTPQVKQEVLCMLVKEIIVGDDTVTIKHIFPIDDFSCLLPQDNTQLTPTSARRNKCTEDVCESLGCDT